jgi:hypothetical protein
LKIGSGFRLGKTDAAPRFPFRKPWQEALLLIFGAEVNQDVAQNGMRPDNAGKAHPSSGEFFKNNGKSGVVDIAPAEFVRDVESEQAKTFHGLDQRVWVFPAMFHPPGDRNNFTFHKIAHRSGNHFLVFVEFRHRLFLCVTDYIS